MNTKGISPSAQLEPIMIDVMRSSKSRSFEYKARRAWRRILHRYVCENATWRCKGEIVKADNARRRSTMSTIRFRALLLLEKTTDTTGRAR